MRYLALVFLISCGDVPYDVHEEEPYDAYEFDPGASTLEDPMITNGEAYWCAVGTTGAAIISSPFGAFLYAMACGAWADMDTW
jgi:hypothetical protein